MHQEFAPGGQQHRGFDKSWKTSHLPLLQTRESQFLLEMMRAWYHRQAVPEAIDLNWPVLWEYIDRHGLGGVLGALTLDGLLTIPDEFEEAASHRYFSTQMHFAQAKRSCEAIQQAAEKLDIPVIIMKGPALIEQAYADTGVRQFSDIDLFTRSLADVKKLCAKLGAVEIKSSAHQGYLARLGESECCAFMFENWELEFRYPIEPPGEPMFALLSFHRDSLIKIPRDPLAVLQPEPELHLVYLIQHMAIHHLMSRFFWFLDIAVFLRQHPQLDWERVERELERFGQLGVASVITHFCRDNIDSNLPVFSQKTLGWNKAMMHSFATPQNISSGKYGIYHENLVEKAFAYLLGMVSFYLIADAGEKRSIAFSGTWWTCSRIANSLGLRSSFRLCEIFCFPFVAVTLLPITSLLVLYTKITKA